MTRPPEILYVDVASQEMQPYVERQRTPVGGKPDTMVEQSGEDIRRLAESLRHMNTMMSLDRDGLTRNMMVVRRSNELRLAALERSLGARYADKRHP